MEKMRLITPREKSFPTRARETFFFFRERGGGGRKADGRNGKEEKMSTKRATMLQ